MDFLKNILSQGGAQGLGGLAQLLGIGSKNPSEGANEYLSQIPGVMGKYYNPYINSGSNALEQLQSRYGQMSSNPSGVYDKLSSGYSESPGFKFKLHQALGAGDNAKAAGGMLGTPAHEQQNMQLANDISSQDFNDYLNHILGLYGSGLQGLGNLNEQGYHAATDYGSSLGNVLGQQAQYKYAGDAGNNQRNSSGLSNIFGGLSSMFL